VSVRGEHDLNTAEPLAAQLNGLIDESTPVVVELTEATFIDSSILGVVLDARRRAHAAGLGFEVIAGEGVGEGVARVLEVTGLNSTLPVLTDRGDAVKRAGAGPPA
jgi:anti-sigma B factor antagonist